MLTSATAILTQAAAGGHPALTQPWIMRQTWRDLLFAHWPVAPAEVAAHLPPGLELDTRDGHAWIGVVPFVMSGIHPRGLPSVPGLSAFPELNVRTYVTAGGRPGVWFTSLDAGNPIAVRLARSIFHLPYFDARFIIERAGESVRYGAQRTHRGAPAGGFSGEYQPAGPVFRAQPGTIEYFLTERYRLYTTGAHGQLLHGEIRHLPWPLQPAAATITQATVARAAGFTLPDSPPHLLFARRLDVLVWPLGRVVTP